MNTMSQLLLIDGSGYLFRAYHALPHLTNRAGFPTGALFGVLSMLKKLREDFAPERALIVFDAKGPNFRHRLYPAYKAHRLVMPEDLARQIPPLHEMISHFGFPLYSKPGVEADDIIGTLAKRHAALGEDVLILSSDKDLTQLLAPHIRIHDPLKNFELDDAYLLQKFGIPAAKMLDFLSLTGDSSDNIPGLPGVGPKTASAWLSTYGSLAGIIEHRAEIKGKAGATLAEHLEQLELSKKLVTLDTTLALDDLPSFVLQPPDFEILNPLLLEYGLKSLTNGAATFTATSPNNAYHLIQTEAELNNFISRLAQQPSFAFDTETNGLDALQADLIGISFAFNAGEAYFIPVRHHTLHTPPNAGSKLGGGLLARVPQQSEDVSEQTVNPRQALSRHPQGQSLAFDFDAPPAPEANQRWPTQVLSALAPILENPRIGKIAHHAKFDLKVLHKHGIQVQGLIFDTLLASYVLNSTANRHNLAEVAERELGLHGMSFEDLIGTGRHKIAIEATDLQKLTTYACEDADFTWQIYQSLSPKLEANAKLKAVFYDLEMPLLHILARMEEYGVLINTNALKALSAQWDQRLEAISAEIYLQAGVEFNLNSPKQLLHILFEKLNLPVMGKTPKGEPSTNEATLQELAPLHPVPKLLLEHRHLSKLKNTYADKLPLLVHPLTGRIHTQYQQAVVATGRLSSTDPNLQNIPFKTEEGKKIRAAFVAAPGSVLISADYSQIELRIMAHLSGDVGLINAFQAGRDIHRATAAEVLGIPETDVTPEQRNRAKAVNFGLIYGMSSFGLAKQLNISRKEADAYIQRYFERYPGVLAYMEKTRERAHEQGFVETLLGRRLMLPQIHSKNMLEKKGAERAAINAPMQGTAADLIKKAMIEFAAWLEQHKEFNAHLIMQVHDELIVEAEARAAPQVTAALKTLMEQAFCLNVPLVVDVSTSTVWE